MTFDNMVFDTSRLLSHLRGEKDAFVLPRRGGGPVFPDQEVHDAAYRDDPERYALACLADDVLVEQRARVLFQLLRRSRKGLSGEVRKTLERVTAYLLSVLSPDRVLTVFLAVRRSRANHKHTQRAILRYLLDHPRLEDMARRRRPAVREGLEHALARDTARGCAKAAAGREPGEAYLERHLLRFTNEPERAKRVVRFLFRDAEALTPRGKPYRKLHPAFAPGPREERKRPRTVTPTNRGDVAATLVHIYRGGSNPELGEALKRYTQEAASRLPRFDGRVALVLDASESTRGYGEREYCCISQSVALVKVMEKCCADVLVYQVGGATGSPPAPQGATDLASALLDALEASPALVAILSDGYENRLDGELAGLVDSLPGAGVRTPVVFCHSLFTDQDDLELRQPAPVLPSLSFWHQDDFEGLLTELFSMAEAEGGTSFFRRHMLQKLERFERENRPWLVLT